MQSFGFLLGQRFFEKNQAWGVSGTWDVRRMQTQSQRLDALICFYANLGNWPPMANPVADFWLGFESCKAPAPVQPKPKKIQLAMFS